MTPILASPFLTSFSFIEEVRQGKGKVLVHCAAGLNRSVTVAIALKMQLDGLSLRNAVEEILRKRGQICPFRDNRAELLKFERRLRGTNSITAEEFASLVKEGSGRSASTPPSPTNSSSTPSPLAAALSREKLTSSLPVPVRPKSAFSFPALSCALSSCFPSSAPRKSETLPCPSPPKSDPFASVDHSYLTSSPSYSDFSSDFEASTPPSTCPLDTNF